MGMVLVPMLVFALGTIFEKASSWNGACGMLVYTGRAIGKDANGAIALTIFITKGNNCTSSLA